MQQRTYPVEFDTHQERYENGNKRMKQQIFFSNFDCRNRRRNHGGSVGKGQVKIKWHFSMPALHVANPSHQFMIWRLPLRNRLAALLLLAVIAMLPSFTQAAATKNYAAKITITPAVCTIQAGNPLCGLYFSAASPTPSIPTNANYLISNQGKFGASGACSLVKANYPSIGIVTISLDSVGTCTVTASLDALDNGYKAVGSAQYTFQIPKTNVSFRDVSNDRATSLLAGSTITNSVLTTFNQKKNAPILGVSVNTPDICEIRIDTLYTPDSSLLQTTYRVTGKSGGICTVTYTTPETDDFFASSNTKSFTITSNKTIPTLTVCDTPDIVVGATGQACFSTNAPGGAALTSRDTSICTVSASTVTAVAPGVCEVAIATYPSDTLDSATAVQRINIINRSTETSKPKQVITFGPAPQLGVGDSNSISVTGGDSGNPVTLSSLSTDVCTVSGATVTAVDVGVCRINANQDGNDSYNAAEPALLSFNIGGSATKTDQTINFAPTSDAFSRSATYVLFVGETATLTGTGGSSGNPLVFSSQSPAVCSVKGSTVSALAAGLCIVAADQDGNAQFNSAPQVTQSITVAAVAKTVQSIGIMDIAPLAVGESASVKAAGGASGQPVVLSVLTPDSCSVTGTTLNALAAGTCTITADQAGDNTYAAATQAKLDVRITAKAYPFAAAISAAGSIDNQTLEVLFTPSSDDAGLTGVMFVGASLDSKLYLLGSSGWVPYNAGDALTPFMTGPLVQQDIAVLSNADLTPLEGAQLFFGYGLGTDLEKAYANMTSRQTLIQGYIIHDFQLPD